MPATPSVDWSHGTRLASLKAALPPSSPTCAPSTLRPLLLPRLECRSAFEFDCCAFADRSSARFTRVFGQSPSGTSVLVSSSSHVQVYEGLSTDSQVFSVVREANSTSTTASSLPRSSKATTNLRSPGAPSPVSPSQRRKPNPCLPSWPTLDTRSIKLSQPSSEWKSSPTGPWFSLSSQNRYLQRSERSVNDRTVPYPTGAIEAHDPFALARAKARKLADERGEDPSSEIDIREGGLEV